MAEAVVTEMEPAAAELPGNIETSDFVEGTEAAPAGVAAETNADEEIDLGFLALYGEEVAPVRTAPKMPSPETPRPAPAPAAAMEPKTDETASVEAPIAGQPIEAAFVGIGQPSEPTVAEFEQPIEEPSATSCDADDEVEMMTAAPSAAPMETADDEWQDWIPSDPRGRACDGHQGHHRAVSRRGPAPPAGPGRAPEGCRL
jgi:hypothetical protein